MISIFFGHNVCILLGVASIAPAASSTTTGIPFNWFDAFVLVLMAIGVMQGRRQGMSGEVLDLIQWLFIIVGGGLIYRPLGRLFAQISGMGLLWSYLLVYLTLALIFKVIMTLFKKSIGEKLVGSGVFGPMEYYLGMFSGMVRLLCFAMLIMAVLHARKVSETELQAQLKAQTKELGKVYFPPLGSIQLSVFKDSFIGSFVEQNLAMLLIDSTESSAGRESLGTRRQRELDDVLGNK